MAFGTKIHKFKENLPWTLDWSWCRPCVLGGANGKENKKEDWMKSEEEKRDKKSIGEVR